MCVCRNFISIISEYYVLISKKKKKCHDPFKKKLLEWQLVWEVVILMDRMCTDSPMINSIGQHEAEGSSTLSTHAVNGLKTSSDWPTTFSSPNRITATACMKVSCE